MKVLFDTKTVQKFGRIVLSDTLLHNAGLKEGDTVNIYFDVANKHIVIQRAGDTTDDSAPEEGASRKRSK